MEDFMPLTPLPSTCVCRSLDGQSSEAQSPVLRFIRRLILPLKYWSFTESVMQLCMIPNSWIRLSTNVMLAMYLTEPTLIFPDSMQLNKPELFLLSGRSFIQIIRLQTVKTCLRVMTISLETKQSDSQASETVKIIRFHSDVSFTLPLTLEERSHIFYQ